MLSRKNRHPETSAFKKVFDNPDGEIILEDIAGHLFGRSISEDMSNEALRTWAGEIKLFKYILTKTYKTEGRKKDE